MDHYNSLGQMREKEAPYYGGLLSLILNTLLIIGSLILFVYSMILIDSYGFSAPVIILTIVTLLYAFIVGPLLYAGLKIVRPNEALVLTLFGKYYGSIKKEGFYFVNPFCQAVNPTTTSEKELPSTAVEATGLQKYSSLQHKKQNKKISLKAMTLNNERQKVNDSLGNPIIIGIIVIWKIVDTAKAVFNIDNYFEYLSIQCDAALRNSVRLYPYDSDDEQSEMSLRGSSQEVAKALKEEIQKKMEVAGIEILEARITHLSYAPEIAAAMLQRQQATALIAARQKIVEGAVGMVEMALEKLKEQGVVDLDEERKATMVSNLLVVLVGSRDAQPIVNTGSLY